MKFADLTKPGPPEDMDICAPPRLLWPLGSANVRLELYEIHSGSIDGSIRFIKAIIEAPGQPAVTTESYRFLSRTVGLPSHGMSLATHGAAFAALLGMTLLQSSSLPE